MTNFITFLRLRSVIIQQGIVTQAQIQPQSDFQQDLNYKTSDLLELARLIDQNFHIQLTQEEASELTTVHDTISVLNRLLQFPDLAERF